MDTLIHVKLHTLTPALFKLKLKRTRECCGEKGRRGCSMHTNRVKNSHDHHHSVSVSLMDRPCEICGDIGIAEVISTCCKCKRSREHIYCMHPNLKFIPESWCCEACCQKMNHNSICSSDAHRKYCNEEVHRSFERNKRWANKTVPSKVPDLKKAIGPLSGEPPRRLLSRNFVPKKVETGKVKFLPLEDIYAESPKKSSLLAGPSSQIGSFGANNRSAPTRTTDAMAVYPKISLEEDRAYKSRGHLKPQTVGKIQNCNLQKQAVKLSQPLHTMNSPPHFPSKSSSRENSNSLAVVKPKDKRHISDLSRIDNHTEKLDSLKLKGYACKPKPFNATTRSHDDRTSFKFGEEDLPNRPAADVSWKGNFEILNLPNECFAGFHAHPPEKVSRKAYLVSKQMPGVLQLTLQPRHVVWPEIFQKVSPSGSDIALYFGVDDFCREKYNRLLKLMEKQDLSMRSCLDGVELLIFTSRQLPIESQRMNKQFYLWGVYLSLKGCCPSPDLKGKQKAVGLAVLHNKNGENSASMTHKADDQVMDMEIDMVGGKKIGSIDTFLRSNSRTAGRDNLDMPSQTVFSGVHSHQPVEESTLGRHLHQIKTEHCDNFDAPRLVYAPGLPRPISSSAAGATSHTELSPALRKVDAPSSFSGPKFDPPPGFSAHKVDPPPGFSVHKVDALPGSCKSITLKERDSTSEVTAHGKGRDPVSTWLAERNGGDLPLCSTRASQENSDDYGTKVGELRHGSKCNVLGDSQKTVERQEEEKFHMKQKQGLPSASEFHLEGISIERGNNAFPSSWTTSNAKCLKRVRHRERATLDQQSYSGSKKIKAELGCT